MFRPSRKALEKWFDSVTDGWNPIIVRELRRAVRSGEPIAGLGIHLAGLVVLQAIVHFGGFKESLFVDIFVRSFPTFIVLLVTSSETLGRIERARRDDELFDIVPLSPRVTVKGYFWSSCLILAFVLTPALPFLAFHSETQFIVPVRLGVLLGCFLVAQVVMLFFFSFSIRTISSLETAISTMIVFVFGIFAPFVAATCLWLTFYSEKPLFLVLIGVATAAMFSLGCCAYCLSLHHFTWRLKSGRTASLLNLGVYLLWSAFWGIAVTAVLYFIR